jgi:hypothetical protein
MTSHDVHHPSSATRAHCPLSMEHASDLPLSSRWMPHAIVPLGQPVMSSHLSSESAHLFLRCGHST